MGEEVSKADLERINQTIQTTRSELDDTSSARREARSALKSAEVKLSTTHRKIDTLINQQQDIKHSLDALNERKTTLEQDRADQQAALAKQMAGLYRLGQDPQIKLLLDQGDPTRIARFQHYLNVLNKARRERLDALAQLNQDLANNTRALKQQQSELEQNLAALTQQRDRLTAQRSTRASALERLNATYSSQRQRLASLEDDRTHVESLLENMQRQLEKAHEKARTRPQGSGLTAEEEQAEAPRTIKASGKTGTYPVTGARLLTDYRQGKGVHKNGILLAAKAGSSVRAMAGGQVVFANWLRGFGYLVIVDDASNVLTLYAHNQQLTVSTGDRVEKGAVIARVGDTGGLDQPALYFEVRKGGHPTNPLRWLSRH
ncbi:murein hydrolase activator EnvC family protein [Larsenimonas salina]|uniref:murein hydrolase activator EnvC family protein n=1 Tax=Larsenimonas salina TaxID=1295565 RepID=UPI002073245F|nr:peptidoglycan DD-metalloendopeptidase family protein [Larsenimonas salina]MCM5704633.1 peptidoglycan DD-metalloendopeptidase family protein [Larsenimonas salina]